MFVRQVELVDDENHHIVCWLPEEDGHLKVGMRISLKGDHGVWTIEEIYSRACHYEINKKWPVGGM